MEVLITHYKEIHAFDHEISYEAIYSKTHSSIEIMQSKQNVRMHPEAQATAIDSCMGLLTNLLIFRTTLATLEYLLIVTKTYSPQSGI